MYMSKIFEDNLEKYAKNPNVAKIMLYENHHEKIASLNGLFKLIH